MPSPANCTSISERLLTCIFTSAGLKPMARKNSAPMAAISASASMESLPSRSMFHWKNSRERPIVLLITELLRHGLHVAVQPIAERHLLRVKIPRAFDGCDIDLHVWLPFFDNGWKRIVTDVFLIRFHPLHPLSNKTKTAQARMGLRR